MRQLLRRPGSAAFAALLLAGWAVPQAGAQYYPPSGNVYPYAGRGGYLAGSSQVIDAYGQLGIQQEQARLQREQVEQAKLDTRKKAFDQRMYEKANTPSWTEEQLKIDATIVRRVMLKPTEVEIKTGKAANIILPYLQQLANQGIDGPPVPLNQGQLRQINVKTSSADGSVGILKGGAPLDWPLVLQGPNQKKLDELLPQTISGVVNGTLTPKQMREVTNTVSDLKDELKKKFYKEEIDGGEYLTGKRFMESLEEAVNTLRQPNAAKLLSGTFAAKGRTVEELVRNMTQQGLLFAAGAPGTEPAYRSLHSAMVSYAAGAQQAPGFRVPPPRGDPYQGPPGGYRGPR
jgi:hypothetical protein